MSDNRNQHDTIQAYLDDELTRHALAFYAGHLRELAAAANDQACRDTLIATAERCETLSEHHGDE